VKILVADDDPVSRLMLSRLLGKQDCEVVVATNGVDAWQILQQGGDAPKLAILDWMMPGLDGLEVCRRIRSQNGSYTYALLLTSRHEKRDILSGLAAGADDYLTKPVDPAELKARLDVGHRILDLQDRLLRAYEARNFEATHDQLTGLWNRPAILQQFHTEWERSRREGTDVAVLLADVDHFKLVNDTHGHLAGDAVLRQDAVRMKVALRPYDAIGRYGGEEFLLIVPNCDASQALTVAERMRSSVSHGAIDVPGGSEAVSVSISIGAAAVCAESAGTEDAALQAADSALYRAKQCGRNRTEVISCIPA
jgi:diguanylate cyclase (GGDEF)-like protein